MKTSKQGLKTLSTMTARHAHLPPAGMAGPLPDPRLRNVRRRGYFSRIKREGPVIGPAFILLSERGYACSSEMIGPAGDRVASATGLLLSAENIAQFTSDLETAVASVLSDQPLPQTAEAMIKALERLPGAGRFAAFEIGLTPDDLEPIAAPSFPPQDVDRLAQTIARLDVRAASGSSADEIEGPVLELGGVAAAAHNPLVYPLMGKTGEPLAVIVMVRDAPPGPETDIVRHLVKQLSRIAGLVIEDRRLRSDLRDRQALFQSLTSTIADAVIRIDAAGDIVGYAGGAKALFGYRPKDVLGRPLKLLMPAEHNETDMPEPGSVGTWGVHQTPDFGRRMTARTKTGKLIPVEIALSQFQYANEVQFVGVVRDISQRLDDEVRLEDLRQALDLAMRHSALGEMAASIAHELNQPITAVANYMDAADALLKDAGAIDRAALKRVVQAAGGQARLGGEIIRRMRRLTAKRSPVWEEADFHSAISEAAGFFKRTAISAGVDLTIRQSGAPGRAVFDKVQIQQVVSNLIANALKAMSGSSNKTLLIETELSATHAELRVADTGPGVPDHRKATIFESFVTHHEGGLGIGLAVSKRIAEAHGGRLFVEDAPDGGALFCLVIPRHPESSDAETA